MTPLIKKIFVRALSLFLPRVACIGLMTVVLLCSLSAPGRAETFFGDSPTGFLELDQFKHPVYLIVPDQYKPTRPLPLVVALFGEGQKLKEYAEQWVSISKRRSMIIIVPGLLVGDSDVPYAVDKWVLRIKADVMRRYRISKDRQYLVGMGTGAHYASYLGINYPNEFTGVGLMGASWTGPFEAIMTPEKHPSLQTPFYAAFSVEDAGKLMPAREKAEMLSSKGYPIHVEELGEGEEYRSIAFKKKMFKWLDEKGVSWQQVVRETKQPWRQKFKKWLERNISPK